MSDTVIKLENISKQYRLGVVGTGTLSHDLNRWWARIRGKEDPTLKIGQSNQLDTVDGDYVWALRDINLEVKQGEVLGIIGKNGAGKSTLLKILSRVTGPTTGNIKVKGRIASLLEVGTGFHPELTGRENIFLNGAILGMTKQEIKSKLDEIVDFAGVAKYLETPVKRYSSGMYVRLAFAVAAHLDPEILVVDEVLAVGDAEFQKKAIGKMQDISKGGGRTVLFVSHSMNSINRLCTRALLLANGQIREQGPTEDIVNRYLRLNDDLSIFKYSNDPENEPLKDIELKHVSIRNENGIINSPIKVNEPFSIFLTFKLNTYIKLPKLTFHFKNKVDEFVLFSDIMDNNSELPHEEGEYNYTIAIPQPLLKPDHYFLYVGIVNIDNGQTNHFPLVLNFEIVDIEGIRATRAGYIYKPLKWSYLKQ